MTPEPLISVIIKTYNRNEILRKTLESLEGQENLEGINWEIVVVDNNSDDNTKQVVLEFAQKSRIPCRYLFEPQQGRPFALNRGIEETESEFLVFTDDDVDIDPFWVQSIVDTFKRHDADIVGGKVLPLWVDGSPPSWIPKEAYGNLDYGDEILHITDPEMGFWGANQAVKRSALQRFGTYDNRYLLSEDTELVRRVILKGGKVIYQPRSVVYHKIPGSSLKISYLLLLRRHYENGKIVGFVGSDNYRGKALFKGIPNWLARKIFQRLLACMRAIIIQWDVRTALYELIQFVRYLGLVRGLIEARYGRKS